MPGEPVLPTPPRILAVLNCTPDSFSDGGTTDQVAIAELAEQFQLGESWKSVGIDIGGESTAPGSKPISAIEEIDRIRKAIHTFAGKTFVSVDTYKASTADWALDHGADMVNDVSALRAEPELARVAAEHKAYVALMFSKSGEGPPHADRELKEYDDIISVISDFWSARIDFALANGIAEAKIILDPGMGAFVSPNPRYSWEIVSRLAELRERFAGFRILLGASRKGFLGGILTERDPVSSLTGLIAHLHGVDIIRTHNPVMVQEFLRVWEQAARFPTKLPQ